jgi:predicted nucleic acid-binding protein
MIVIDTNVISEFTRPYTSERVSEWFRRQSADRLYTTAITEAELLVAFAVMPDGQRKVELARATEVMLKMFGNRILPFDRVAAREFPNVVIERRASGRDTKEADGLIAAIARANGASVATRNTTDFSNCGIDIVNPWTA